MSSDLPKPLGPQTPITDFLLLSSHAQNVFCSSIRSTKSAGAVSNIFVAFHLRLDLASDHAADRAVDARTLTDNDVTLHRSPFGADHFRDRSFFTDNELFADLGLAWPAFLVLCSERDAEHGEAGILSHH